MHDELVTGGKMMRKDVMMANFLWIIGSESQQYTIGGLLLLQVGLWEMLINVWFRSGFTLIAFIYFTSWVLHYSKRNNSLFISCILQ